MDNRNNDYQTELPSIKPLVATIIGVFIVVSGVAISHPSVSLANQAIQHERYNEDNLKKTFLGPFFKNNKVKLPLNDNKDFVLNGRKIIPYDNFESFKDNASFKGYVIGEELTVHNAILSLIHQ